jgi:hypothetical protein
MPIMNSKFKPTVYSNELDTGHWSIQFELLRADLTCIRQDLACIRQELAVQRWILFYILALQIAQLILLIELVTR